MNKILHPLVRISVAVLFVGVGIAAGQLVLNLLRSVFLITNTGLANLLALVLLTPVTYGAYWLYVHSVEKRDLTELGHVHAFREFGFGWLIGFGLFALVMGILGLVGDYRVTGFNFVWLLMMGAAAGALTSAFAQELIFRGVIYRITEEWLGTGWTVGISALLFGLIHLTNSGATIFSTVAIALQAGVLLAAVYSLTHQLWMVWGLHMAWDFANDGIFGVGMAGQSGQSIHGVFQATLSGPPLLTGAALGVEASVVTLTVALIAGMLMLWIAYQKGQFVSRKK
jgi:uncharacterized protein